MTKTTSTKYGVARGETIVGALFDTIDQAQRHLDWVTDTQALLGVDEEVQLVVVTATTTYGKPRRYTPDTVQVETSTTVETENTEGEQS